LFLISKRFFQGKTFKEGWGVQMCKGVKGKSLWNKEAYCQKYFSGILMLGKRIRMYYHWYIKRKFNVAKEKYMKYGNDKVP
jgi:hypothetical protein